MVTSKIQFSLDTGPKNKKIQFSSVHITGILLQCFMSKFGYLKQCQTLGTLSKVNLANFSKNVIEKNIFYFVNIIECKVQ